MSYSKIYDGLCDFSKSIYQFNLLYNGSGRLNIYIEKFENNLIFVKVICKKLNKIFSYYPKRVFIGNCLDQYKLTEGNSIVLEFDNNEIIYIGADEILYFTLKDKIDSFFNPVGNNLVPYPWIIDKSNNIYLMLEKRVFNTELNFKIKDPYNYFYNINNIKFDKFKFSTLFNFEEEEKYKKETEKIYENKKILEKFYS